MPSTILQSELCSLTHPKRYGHIAIPLCGDMIYRVGEVPRTGSNAIGTCGDCCDYEVWAPKVCKVTSATPMMLRRGLSYLSADIDI